MGEVGGFSGDGPEVIVAALVRRVVTRLTKDDSVADRSCAAELCMLKVMGVRTLVVGMLCSRERAGC